MTTVVYIAAHQDDELLTLGAGILADVAAGHTVYCVLATDGGEDGSRTNGVMEGVLGYEPSREEFVAQRDAEFTHTVGLLGAIPIVSPLRARDGEATGPGVAGLVRAVVPRTDRPLLRATSTHDYHSDHRACGDAVVLLAADGWGTDPRLMLSRYMWHLIPSGVPMYRMGGHGDVTAAHQWAYRTTSLPDWWGIGYRSATDWFNYVTGTDGASYWHRPVGTQPAPRRRPTVSPADRPVWSADRDGWEQRILTPAWEEQLARPDRIIAGWAELVDPDGQPVPVDVRGDTRTVLPLDRAVVRFRGESAEQWSADLAWSDPWMVPRAVDHPLWGVSPLRVRLWWAVWADSEWWAMPVCTLTVGNTSVSDGGLISGSTRGRDMLSTVRGGWTGSLDVSGLPVHEAVRAVLDRVAPTLVVQIAASTIIVPDGITLGDGDPLSDLIELAEVGYPAGVVRTDREGVVIVGPRPEPSGPVLDWQEGPDCPVTKISWDWGIEHMGNSQTVVSTHSDAEGLYVTVDDDDPASPTSVQRWGVRPLPVIETDKATTVDGLTNLGRMHLGKGLKPTEDVSLTVPQRPDLDYQRPALLARQQLGVGSTYRVSSWGLTLGDVSPMGVGMMQRWVS